MARNEAGCLKFRAGIQKGIEKVLFQWLRMKQLTPSIIAIANK